MEHNDFIEVGKVFKTHGIRGGLKVSFNFPLISFKDLRPTSLFVGKAAKPLPYFIKSIEPLGEDLFIVVFEDFETPEKAQKLANSDLFLPEDMAEKWFDIEEVEEGEFTFLEGYTIYDQYDNKIGVIEEVMLYPHQKLARVLHNGAEVLIPLIEDVIIIVDEDREIVQVEIAEGLLGLNLENKEN